MSSDRTGPGGLQQRVVGTVLALVIGLVAVAAYAIRGCEEGPFGRNQIVAITPNQEMQLGLEAYQDILSKSRIVRSGAAAEAVKKVTERLVETIQTSKPFLKITRLEKVQNRFARFEWEVQLVEDRQVNAFCLPGGKMVVFTGILPVCENDAGLATVMGHEISHALSRHGAERMAHQQMAQIGVTATGVALPGDRRERDQVIGLLSAGARMGILKYGRDHETEADHMGLYLMACAGYDPRESVKFWERMKRSAGGGKTPEFLSTHPSHETRIRDLVKWMPEAQKLYNASALKTVPEPLPGVKINRGAGVP